MDLVDRIAHDSGIGKTRTHRVDRDGRPRQLCRQRTGQSDHAVLGRTISGAVAVAFERSSAADINNAAVAERLHICQHQLTAVIGTGQVRGQDCRPQRLVGAMEWRGRGDAGIVDQDADQTVRRTRLREGLGQGRAIGHIPDCKGRVLADRLRRRGQPRRITANQSHHRTVRDQPVRDGRADPAAATGHHRVQACEDAH